MIMRMSKQVILVISLLFVLTACSTYYSENTGVTDIANEVTLDADNLISTSSPAVDIQAVDVNSADVKDINAEETSFPPSVIKIVAVGDIMLGRGVGNRIEKHSDGYKKAFSEVSHILKSGDVVFGNLESPITSRTKSLSKEKKIILKANPSSIEALKTGGFNLISLANNHMMDYYAEGMFDTMDILEENGILYSGTGINLEAARKPAIIEIDGNSFGLLSYSDMVNYVYAGNPNISYRATDDKSGIVPRESDLVLQDVQDLRDKVDILAVSLHWGVEESFVITTEQKEFARELIDNGVDIILGHHPHQFQGIEIYKGKPIFYSLGNFLFDQNDPENMESFIVQIEYTDLKPSSISAIPVRIVDKIRVVKQTGNEAKNILERQIKLCNDLNTECYSKNDILYFPLN
jgi:poly-gamma-glutamate capsule biosynthesis protein CapA/YwtB (metallophosphatase superfamily)